MRLEEFQEIQGKLADYPPEQREFMHQFLVLGMLGARADRATTELSLYSQQVMSLVPRIRESKTTTAKVVANAS